MSGEDWRIQEDGADFLGQSKRRQEIDHRRPRTPLRDLIGPGIRSAAVRVTDWNDLLATYNGTFSSAPGALSAPNAVQAFVGQTMMDGALGGTQTLYPMVPGGRVHYERAFVRNAGDTSSITWGAWTTVDTTPPVIPPPDTRGYFVEASNNSGRTSSGNVPRDYSQPGLLLPPPFRVSGNADSGVFERSGSFWLIRKAGVYQIDMRVWDTNVQYRSFRLAMEVRGSVYPFFYATSSGATKNADGTDSTNYYYAAIDSQTIGVTDAMLASGPVEVGLRAWQISPATIASTKYLHSWKLSRIGGL